tara:strand:+ start:412 stop:597 length:186 start_codon:yes stop_codon:yes gene_type:complete
MKPKSRINLENLNQEQFEMILNALIMLKQSNPTLDVYLNEKFITKVLNEIINNNHLINKNK